MVSDMNTVWIVLALVWRSDSLMNGSVCSGRVEVQSDRPLVSVQRRDFNHSPTAAVRRELGCETLSLLRGALYGEAEEAPTWTNYKESSLVPEFGLLDCGISGSATNSCSPHKTVGVTRAAGPDGVMLVGGTSHGCACRLEAKHRPEWRPVCCYLTDQGSSAVAYRQLVCKPEVSLEKTSTYHHHITSPCVGSAASQCGTSFADTQTIWTIWTIWPDFSKMSPSRLTEIINLLRASTVVLVLIILGCIYVYWKETRDLEAAEKRTRWVEAIRAKISWDRWMKYKQTPAYQRQLLRTLAVSQRPLFRTIAVTERPLIRRVRPQIRTLSAGSERPQSRTLSGSERPQSRTLSGSERPQSRTLSGSERPQSGTLSVSERPQ